MHDDILQDDTTGCILAMVQSELQRRRQLLKSVRKHADFKGNSGSVHFFLAVLKKSVKFDRFVYFRNKLCGSHGWCIGDCPRTQRHGQVHATPDWKICPVCRGLRRQLHQHPNDEASRTYRWY